MRKVAGFLGRNIRIDFIHTLLKYLNRIFYTIFLNFIFRILGCKHIFLRHSVMSDYDFNFFYSDIDYSVVLKEDSKSQGVFLKTHELLKKIFLNLGEIEVYKNEHFKEYREYVSSDLEQKISFIENVRKISYLNQKDEFDSFERDKISRSRSKVFKRLNVLSNGSIDTSYLFNFSFKSNQELLPGNYNDYLGINCTETLLMTGEPHLLFLDSHSRINFLALLPGHDNLISHLGDFVRVRKSIYLYERMKVGACLFDASFRESKNFNELKSWQHRIESCLEKMSNM